MSYHDITTCHDIHRVQHQKQLTMQWYAQLEYLVPLFKDIFENSENPDNF